MSLVQDAEKQWGRQFVNRAAEVALSLGIKPDWLLGIISWETGGFTAYHTVLGANGLPWTTNPGDGGGGLVGFTPLRNKPFRSDGPFKQLDAVGPYFREKMSSVGITTLRSPVEAYLMVRGPAGILYGPKRDMGGVDPKKGRIYTKEWVVTTITDYLVKHGVAWTDTPVGVEGLWTVRIGDWMGYFVFDSQGSVWWSNIPRGAGPADPEIEENGLDDRGPRTYGHWECFYDGGRNPIGLRWQFFNRGKGLDDRVFEVAFKIDPLINYGVIKPPGSGSFKMWRGSPEPL